MKEMVGGCCVCSDERGWPDNPLVYCDGNLCTVAVHQACYGIVTVPTGPWFCRKCEGLDTKIIKVKCELCPSKSGALKRTDTGGWAHVVCALYIPEVRFGNVTSMEPIVLRLIPTERYNKTCYICHDSGKSHRATAGACMQCNKSGCKQQFHVTCAQSLGLLCEEAGNYLDNVKYCGYCQHHYSKLKKGGNVKTIPPYKPVSNDDSQSSDSEGEKEGETSPRASGSGTPTNGGKSKAPARKSSHSGNVSSGKNTPTANKTPTNNAQPIGGKPHSSDKKKASPARRGSSVDTGSKGSTPAPSPQHITEAGGSTPSNITKVTPPAVSPSAKSAEAVGVISTVSVVPIPVTTVTTVAANNVESPNRKSPPVVQSPTSVAPPARTYQESVITNTDAVDTKLTKKRRAMTSTSALHIRGFSPRPEIPEYNSMWSLTSMGEVNVDGVGNRMYKRMKLMETHAMRHSSESPGYSPGRTQSPVRSQSPVAGPSGLNTAGGRKSPIHPQNGAGRSSAWGNLNVGYEMQQPGGSSVGNRDISLSNIPLPPMPPGPPGMKKKRAAMAVATSVATTMAGMPAPTNPSPSMIRSERGAKGKKSAANYSAPHMLGNELNPKSMSAARLQEQLSAELAAHAAGGVGPDPLLPPPLINKAAPTMSSSSGRSSSGTQSLDQLLERQWEQGSQFLMEQAQHFDIASLLSCLHQLRTENVRLEDHVGSLLQRRDHLLAVNARLAIPLTAVATSSGPVESVRCPRENGPQLRGPAGPMPAERSQQLMMREVQQKPS